MSKRKLHDDFLCVGRIADNEYHVFVGDTKTFIVVTDADKPDARPKIYELDEVYAGLMRDAYRRGRAGICQELEAL